MKAKDGIRKLTFWGWLRWLFRPSPLDWCPPIYVRLWNGLMQVWCYQRLPVGDVSTPLHGERHRWWVALENPLFRSRCWWCGLYGYPGVFGPGPARLLYRLGLRRLVRALTGVAGTSLLTLYGTYKPKSQPGPQPENPVKAIVVASSGEEA